MTGAQAQTWGVRAKAMLDYASWAYLPHTSVSATRLYELIATDTIAEQGLYINLGYWKDAHTVDQACEAMVRLLAETVRLTTDDVVLDVGFGFGEQDLYWIERFGPRRIVGINIVPAQVRAARQRVAAHHAANRIQLHLGSATDLPFETGSFTAVTALESAFHFDTRERFFHEAFRVLRPGGRLVLSDIVPVPKPRSLGQRWHRWQCWQTFQRTWASPPANAYPQADYTRKLTQAGFTDVRIESIRDRVFPGYHAYCTTNAEYLRRFNPVIRLHHRLAGWLGVEVVYGTFDYVIAIATKPSRLDQPDADRALAA
jgi:ubiquinone/menaquinone biosynthesis C-methylase UbiE